MPNIIKLTHKEVNNNSYIKVSFEGTINGRKFYFLATRSGWYELVVYNFDGSKDCSISKYVDIDLVFTHALAMFYIKDSYNVLKKGGMISE